MMVLGRIAVREARRNKVRTILVALLTAIPIATVTTLILMLPAFQADTIRNGVESSGKASMVLYERDPETSPIHDIAAIEETIRNHIGQDQSVARAVTTTGYRNLGDGRLQQVAVEETNPQHPVFTGRFPNLVGRFPNAPGEALVHVPLQANQHVDWLIEPGVPTPQVGDNILIEAPYRPQSEVTITQFGSSNSNLDAESELGGDNETSGDGATEESSTGTGIATADRAVQVTVVGTFSRQVTCAECGEFVVFPGTLNEEFHLDFAGQSNARHTWFASFADSSDPNSQLLYAHRLERDLPVFVAFANGDSDPYPGRATTRFLLIVSTTFLLLWTGLIAATGFSIGARRRRREMGLLAANGADPRRLRLISIGEALVVGVLGSGGGIVLGHLAAWILFESLMPELYAALEYLPGWGPFHLRAGELMLIVAIGALGVLSCVVAAVVGTKSLNRQSPGELLSGTSTQPRVVSPWLLSGFIAAAIGFVVLGWETNQRGQSVRVAVIVAGLTLATLGAVLFVIGVIRLVGVFAQRGPLAVRLAARDLVRQGVRTGAATAAVCLSLAVAVTAIVGLEPLPEEYYLDGSEPLSGTSFQGDAFEDTQQLPGGSPGVGHGVFSPRGELGLEGSWAPLDTLDWQRHDTGLMQPRRVDSHLRQSLSVNGFTYVAFTSVLAPESMQICRDVSRTICSTTVSIVDGETAAFLPASVAAALQQHGEANLIDPEAVIEVNGGRDEIHYVDVDSSCRQCTLSFMGEFHTLFMTPQQAELRGMNLNHVLNTDHAMVQVAAQANTIQTSTIDELRVHLPPGWGIRPAVSQDFVYTSTLETANNIARTVILLSANIIVAIVIAITLTLVRLESRSEDQVLAVCGARPSLARQINSCRALLMVLTASIPAVPLGILVWRIGLDQPNVPWRWIFGLIVSAGIVATITGFFTHRRGYRPL